LARALWSGAISFGLVNIPVKLYRATAAASGKSISFHQLHDKCGTRIKQVRRCPHCKVDVPWEHVVKGYELDKGRYVVLTEKDLDQLLPEDDYAAITIENFVALDELDPIFFDRAYYIAPEGSPKAYALLHHALVVSGRVAIARVTLRTRSHLAVVRAREDRLLMSTMFYADEIVDAAQAPGLPSGKAAHVDKKQEQVAMQLVDSMTVAWQPERYRDEYAERASRIIDEKVASGEVKESLAPAAEEARGQVIDLMAALRKSVEDRAAPAGGRARPRAAGGKARARVSRRRAGASRRSRSAR